MALEDVNSKTIYCWYSAALGKLDKTVASSYNDFGKGRENTEYVNGKWNDSSLPYGAHNDNSSYDDIWSAIQEQISDRWFVPSKSEWASFGATFNITSGNYLSKFGLSPIYWSSSQYTTRTVYGTYFNYDNIYDEYVTKEHYVRLATTF